MQNCVIFLQYGLEYVKLLKQNDRICSGKISWQYCWVDRTVQLQVKWPFSSKTHEQTSQLHSSAAAPPHTSVKLGPAVLSISVFSSKYATRLSSFKPENKKSLIFLWKNSNYRRHNWHVIELSDSKTFIVTFQCQAAVVNLKHKIFIMGSKSGMD